MESATPYAISSDVLRGHAVPKREAQRTDEAVEDPSNGCSKCHHHKAMLKMIITTAMIHHTTMGLKW